MASAVVNGETITVYNVTAAFYASVCGEGGEVSTKKLSAGNQIGYNGKFFTHFRSSSSASWTKVGESNWLEIPSNCSQCISKA